MNSFGGPIRSFAEFFRGANGLYFNAVYRANLYALITHNAIINFVMQAVTSGVGNRQGNMRVLNSDYSLLAIKIVIMLNAFNGSAFSGF